MNQNWYSSNDIKWIFGQKTDTLSQISCCVSVFYARLNFYNVQKSIPLEIKHIRKYCRKSLADITFIAIRGVYFENTIDPFLKVKTVKDNCSLTMKLSQVNLWFPNMSELILFSTDLAEPQHFSHLEKFIFTVKQSQVYFGQDDIVKLIILNPRLKSLCINAYQLNIRKFQDIGRHLPILGDLSLT